MTERDLRLLGHFAGMFSGMTRETVIHEILSRLGQGNEIMGARLPGKGGRISRDQLQTIHMVTGNEKQVCDVILDGHHKHWVGIGWIDHGPAKDSDYDKYPVVSDSTDGGLADILRMKPS